MTLGRRGALAGLLGLLPLPGAASGARRDLAELIVPAPAGSAPDRWARGIAPFLERAWPRQPLAVRNRPGRSGLDAMAELAAAPGRRAIAVTTAPVLLARAIEAGEPSPVARLLPLAALVEEPALLVTAPGGAGDLDGLRNGARALPIATPPPGTGAHVTGLRLAERAGLPLLPFPSAAAARQAAASGHVAAAVLTLPDAIGLLRDGRLAALGVAASRRSPLLPEVPTLRETGLELLGATRRGFVLGREAPAEWLAWLVAGLAALAADPDFAAHCGENAQVPRLLGPEPWAALLARQDEELRRRWEQEPWLPRRA